MALWRIFIFLLAGISVASAQQAKTQDMPIKLGDTYEKVKATYQTTLEPESNPTTSAFNKGSTSLRLKTKGVWFFFDKTGKIYTIRMDAPFAGAIGGVKIGDKVRDMTKVLGKPAKTPPDLPGMFTPRSFIYYLDDVTTVNFQANSDDEIDTIFLSK